MKETRKTLDIRLGRRILELLRPYRGWVFLALGMTLGASFLGPLRPKLVQLAIDEHILTGDSKGLLRMVLLIGGVLLGEGVLAFSREYLTQWVGERAIFDVRNRLFQHILRQPLRFFDRTPVGRLITRVTSDVEALSDVLSAGVVTIMGDLARLGFILYFMFTLNVRLALVTLLVLPAIIWVTHRFKQQVRKLYRETRRLVAQLNSFLQEHITGMKIVQVFNREEEELQRFKTINDAHRKAQKKTVFYFALFWPAMEILSSLALGLILWYGGMRALGGTLTLGVLIAFIQYARQFFEPIRNLSEQYNVLQSAMAASERIFTLLETDYALPEPEEPVTLPKVRGDIRFEHVWFTYDDEISGEEPNWVLRDVSFHAAPGQLIALVGATGAGKTTVINLLLRFYEVSRGRILLDGVDIRQFCLSDLRKHIGLVSQDVFLFSGSILENITLGDSAIPREKVIEAARLIGADGFIERLPRGYDQQVLERGVSLSVGQRQLISILRALVHEPEVLVLDEATAHVDTETEHLIQRALELLMRGRTSLVVAHRLSTIQHADRILVMHRGKIREQGTHQELLAQGGLYRKLYELQYREQERVLVNRNPGAG